MHRLSVFLGIALALAIAGELRAQDPRVDPTPLFREVVVKIHRGLVAQARAPWVPDGVRLLVDPTPSGDEAGRWAMDSLAPAGLRDDDVDLILCPDACAPTRPAEIALAFAPPSFQGDRHATVDVEARGIHRKDGDVPAHPWRTTTRYRLEKHGGEWIVSGTTLLRGS